MRPLLLLGLLGALHSAAAREILLADRFLAELPDTVKEEKRPAPPDDPAVFSRFSDPTFQLSTYRWPQVKPAAPLGEIPTQWATGKDWVTISQVTEGRTRTGIPYVTFHARITREEHPPFDSVMTVLRSADGETFMFQTSGDARLGQKIRDSLRLK